MKASEDLEALETCFRSSSHLAPIEDPADKVETWTPTSPSSKAFFSDLAARMLIEEDEAKAKPKTLNSRRSSESTIP